MKLRLTFPLLPRILAIFIVLAPIPGSVVGQVSADRFAGMRARNIGPVGAIGRISALDAVVSDPNVVYLGGAAGGLWKSVNGGQTWRAVFEGQPFSAIGAVAVDQADPDIVWVGIGEGNPTRGPTSAAVYRSLDGGETWAPRGLAGLENVDRILLHPTNPEIAFVGVSGPKWEVGADRGVYRTMDGGLTWVPVLFVDETTGVSDLVMDPSDPNHLLAAMSSSRRSPWSITPRGPGSGLYLTRDGGVLWIRLEEADGIPGGELGRIALDVFRADPRVVHALVDSGEGVLLRSYNRGRTWETVSRSPDLISPLDDPGGIVADPVNESRLFHLTSHLSVSDDGGATFERNQRGAGPGYRVLWIHPEDPRLMYGGTDRGPYVSRDGGENWDPMGDLQLGSFNHASIDMETPFNVYGGLERNGSWRGPSYGWDHGGTRNGDWLELGSDDDFGILVDPNERSHGYAVARDGGLVRFNLETGERKLIRPWAPAFTNLRLNPDAPIALDPHNPAGIFYGSQFVHKSTNRGETWQIISGDLTANDPAGRRVTARPSLEPTGLTTEAQTVGGPEEGGATITVIAPSSLDPDLIWVGTDEGDVQLTRSAGGEWESVRRRVGGVPDSSWVAHIEPSAVRPGSAIVAFDAHRTGNREPLIYSTDNYGRNWRRIGRDSDIEGFVHTVKQDVIAENLLFAGTETGLYVSLNRGEDWFRWTHGLPRVPIHDLVLHPRDHDLVIATHGRGAYVLDDIRPLRELALDLRVADLEIFVFELPPASTRSGPAPDAARGLGAEVAPWREERPSGVLISYWLREGEVGRGERGVPGVARASDGGGVRVVGDGVVRVGGDGVVRVGGDGVVRVDGDGVVLGGGVQVGGSDVVQAGGNDDLGGTDGPERAEGQGQDDAADGLPVVSVEILDFEGQVIRTFQGPGARGINRVTWDLLEDPPTLSGPLARFSDASDGTDEEGFRAAEVLPGLFTVRISGEGVQGLQWLEVLEDPRVDVELEDRIAKYQAVKQGVTLDARLRALQAAVANVHDDLQRVMDWVREGSGGDVELLDASQALADELAGLADFRVVMRHRSGVLGLTSSYDQPTEGQRLDLIRMEEELDAVTLRIGDFLILDINRFSQRVDAAGLDVSFFVGPIG